MSVMQGIRRMFDQKKAVVLMYHRIASPAVDPWQLSVSAENFEAHLRVLQQEGNVVSISELVQSIEQKSLKKNVICITFDDGYEDNYLHALPLLAKYDCPATFFIASGLIDSNEPYWWDALGDIFLLKEKLPENLDIAIGDKTFTYQLRNDGKLTEEEKLLHSKWYWPIEPPTQRCEIYLNIWMELRNRSHATIATAVNQLKAWSGIEWKNDTGNFPMSGEQLTEMAAHPLVGIGVHTVTHAALGALSKEIQVAEIAGCKNFLDGHLNHAHEAIAFPYGFYNNHTREAVTQAGLKAGFTTDAKPVTPKSDILQMGRYQIVDQNGNQFKAKLDKLLGN